MHCLRRSEHRPRTWRFVASWKHCYSRHPLKTGHDCAIYLLHSFNCKFWHNVLYSAPAAFFCDSVTIILTFIIIIRRRRRKSGCTLRHNSTVRLVQYDSRNNCCRPTENIITQTIFINVFGHFLISKNLAGFPWRPVLSRRSTVGPHCIFTNSFETIRLPKHFDLLLLHCFTDHLCLPSSPLGRSTLVWNCLATSTRSANTFSSFRRCLQSELFAAAYDM